MTPAQQKKLARARTIWMTSKVTTMPKLQHPRQNVRVAMIIMVSKKMPQNVAGGENKRTRTPIPGQVVDGEFTKQVRFSTIGLARSDF